jgi:hypothetical protein
MTHINNDDLVLFYYGELAAPAAAEGHLAVCPECRANFRALQSVLNTVDSAPVPERDPEYGSAVWQKIQGRLPRRRASFSWTSWWLWAPAVAALLLAAFLAGRLSHGPAPAVATGKVRERILLVAVGDHLERSQMVLAELTNSPEGKGQVDISDERLRAADLLEDNRLYRQTARTTGDAAVAGVLDDLERVLIEIAHSPDRVSGPQLDDLRHDIEDRGLLFKVRVLGSQVRQRETEPSPGPGNPSADHGKPSAL